MTYVLALAGLAAVSACTVQGEPQPSMDATPTSEVQVARPPSTEDSLAAGRSESPQASSGDSAAADAPAASQSGVRDAAVSPSPTSPPPDPAGSRPPVPAPVLELADAQDEGARILRGAAAAYEGVRSLQAEFTMKLDNPVLRTSTTSRGTLYQRRPDRILLKFSEPAGDVIAGDGTYFWVYYPSVDAQQVMRAPAEQAGSGGVDLQAQFVGDPVQRFDYDMHGQENVDGRPAHVLTMVPKGDAGYEKLKVWVDTRDSLVRRFELTEPNGAVRRFDLRDLQLNTNLADSLFRFTPPAGARVIQRD
jgi:outer membrane lipoprotein carrier protein